MIEEELAQSCLGLDDWQFAGLKAWVRVERPEGCNEVYFPQDAYNALCNAALMSGAPARIMADSYDQRPLNGITFCGLKVYPAPGNKAFMRANIVNVFGTGGAPSIFKKEVRWGRWKCTPRRKDTLKLDAWCEEKKSPYFARNDIMRLFDVSRETAAQLMAEWKRLNHIEHHHGRWWKVQKHFLQFYAFEDVGAAATNVAAINRAVFDPGMFQHQFLGTPNTQSNVFFK